MAGQLKEFNASYGVNASVAQPHGGQVSTRRGDKRNPEMKKPSQGNSGLSTPGQEKVQETASRAEMVDYMVEQLKELTDEEVQDLFGRMTNEDSQEENQEEQASSDLSDYRITSEDIDIEDHLNALFGDAQLSDDFKVKARTIFETAVVNKVNDVVTEIEQDAAVYLSEAADGNLDALVEDVDRYLSAVTNNWLEENRLAVSSGIKSELTENFIGGLRQLFTDCYIDVPEDKVDGFDAMCEEVERLEAMLNEQLEENISLKEELEGRVRDEIIESVGENLTDSQVAKLKTLSENLAFENPQAFANKVETLVEGYLTEQPGNTKKVIAESNGQVQAESDDDEPIVENEQHEGRMGAYVGALKRTVVPAFASAKKE